MFTKTITHARKWLLTIQPLTQRGINRLRLISLAILLGMTIGVVLLPGSGFDWYAGYALFADDPFISARPTWIYLLIEPIAHLPDSFAWFTLLNAIFLAAALLLVDLPHPLLVLTMPAFWVLFYGQIDGWVALGAVLGWRALQRSHPYLLGLSLLLLSSKPHIGLPLALFFMLRGRTWKMLVIPAAVLLVSFIPYGFWPLAFIQALIRTPVEAYTRQTINITLWPWSLAILPILTWRWKKMSELAQSAAVLAITCLLAPYSPAYSLITLLFLTHAWPLLALLMLPAWGGWGAARWAGMAFALGALAWALFGSARVQTSSETEQLVNAQGECAAKS